MHAVLNNESWQIKRVRPTGARRGGDDTIPAQFLADGVTVEEVIEAAPKTTAPRRGGDVPVIDLTVSPDAGTTCVLAVRHASGALTFHFGEATGVAAARRGARGPSTPAALRFQIVARQIAPPAESPADRRRRGIVDRIIKVVVLKVAAKIVDAVLPRLVLAYEQRSWAKRGLAEGWFRVDRASLASGQLAPAVPQPDAGRTLVLLHGTFSHAAAAFGDLAGTEFFDRVGPLYGDRIFAFNHFSLGRTPEENARDLLEALPTRGQTFDVITHSRGGLVLRQLVERQAEFGELAERFELGHAVLVGAPNDGTPLATPQRWEATVGWIANVLELLPTNPWTTAAGLVAEALVWLAWRVSGGCPGIHAMDSAGPLVASLQQPPGPPPGLYSALVANYHPTGNVAQRMLDVGLDWFFGSANDLAVPTEGGWRTDRDGSAHVPAERIGCFGPGGNLAAPDVQHMNFFSQRESVDFLLRALAREPQPLRPIDPTRPLPDRRFRSAAPAAPAVETTLPAPALPGLLAPVAAPTSPRPRAGGRAQAENPSLAPVFSDAFHLMILPPPRTAAGQPAEGATSQLLAMYRGARVLQPFPTRGDAAGQRFRRIIAMNVRIRKYVNGDGATLPNDDELLEFGEVLFETIFPTEVRRLYDVARSDERATRLNIIFTSMIPWIADKPWEFAYDRARGAFLATEEIQFVRNVVTGVPAQVIPPRPGRLRILVVVAQPVGTAPLSTVEEEAVIRRGFEPLVEAGMAEIEVLPKATPATLHGYVATGRYDVVHFIGHGEFDAEAKRGYLLFEDGRGAATKVDDRSLREILCQREIRLVFLNACETGQGGQADFNRGVAPALVAGGVPVVVANQYKVLDVSATTYAQHLYWSLAQGMTIGRAARESRIAVNYSLTGESIDWAVPVVYARDPNLRLCLEVPVEAKPAIAPQTTRRARRSTEKHVHRVAVWDVDHMFPGLEATLALMSAAQDRFGFLSVNLSAPIGTWQLSTDRNRKVAYLHADRVAARLRNKVSELGVDFLACVTRHWMQSDVTRNRYAWWHADSPVLLFTTADFELPASGKETDRAIANVIVGALAAKLGDSDYHEKGNRHCPLYHSPDHTFSYLVERLTFDAACRRHLRKTIPADLPALETLLRLFHPAEK